MNRYILALAGPSAAGTTTVAKSLKSALKEVQIPTEVLGSDNYYLDFKRRGFSDEEINVGLIYGLHLNQQRALELGLNPTVNGSLPLSYDHPDACDSNAYKSDIERFQSGQIIVRPEYSFPSHGYPIDGPVKIIPQNTEVLIVEGLHVLNPTLQLPTDLKVYLTTPHDICDERRIERDQKQRGRELDQIHAHLRSTVWPAREHFVAPTRTHADRELLWVGDQDTLSREVISLVQLVYQQARSGQLPSLDPSSFSQAFSFH